ncbi:penicillin-binding protein activator [Haliea sp. E1-2-M8]|uniref:penicillin-binding protein activator n=1 Tax=Haliea sp. E1-2-M8 TaxID=3064706 RepID=UPI00271B3863|nr:penicillin-binding protein activator [Haliea sp. E1-2-M8]MDO8861385.1 penicillin-binding protein activator [Haliea sp. E1-2-M8]
MTSLITKRIRTADRLWPALILALLAGCAGAPPAPVPEQEPAVAPEVAAEPVAVEPPQMPSSRWDAVFSSARSALAGFDWMQAEQTLAALEPPLNANETGRRDYLLARAAFLRGDLARVERLLQGIPDAEVARALLLQRDDFARQIAASAGRWLESARIGVRQLGQGAGDTILQREIWRDLNRLREADLAAALNQADAPDWRGWLQLALLNATAGSVAELQTGLQQWRREHPEHAAAAPLPGGLEFLAEALQPLQKVALLLPFGGPLEPAARAVRDGYLAHHYAARARGGASHEVAFVDTDEFPSAVAAYQHAVANRADLVIGPLSKEGVTELGQLNQRPVPVLALNRIDQPVKQDVSALVQLSLAPEDDAARIAELAFGQGARRALVLRPAGARGARLEEVLRQRWQALGGSIATTASYSSPEAYSDQIKHALNLGASEQRARDIRSMLAANIEFTARRRQDIDVVFLLAGTPAEARSLKPLLAFHYAGTLPVYATSSIYGGLPDPRNRDLSGARLVELPWLLGSNPSLRVAIAAGGTGSDDFSRLNALGADAWLLQARFAQLQGGADTLIRGSTGLLRLDPGLRILREPELATFDGSELTRP